MSKTKEKYMDEIYGQKYETDNDHGHRLSVLCEIAWQLKRIADKMGVKK